MAVEFKVLITQTPAPAMQVGILLTVRFLPMPNVTRLERLLVRAVDGIPNYYQVWVGEGVEKRGGGGSSWVKQRQGARTRKATGAPACSCAGWQSQ